MQASSEDAEKGPLLSEVFFALERQRRIEPGLIARLIRECELFREICADYEECCARLLSLEKKGDAAVRQVRDYVEMRDELERELLRCLEGAASCRECGRTVEQAKKE